MTTAKTILERGVEEVIVREHLSAVLAGEKKLRVKFGIDPTAPQLHLGHLVPLRKLRQFQEIGHTLVLIIGDFTATIGDPSGRSETRKPLIDAEVKHNLKEYLAQAGKFLNMEAAEVRYNSEWHGKEGAHLVLEMAQAASIQQILKRDDFEKRLKDGNDISILEILYPLFQGYDSVAVKADVEVGGTDQKFNLLMGRRVQRFYNLEEQDVLSVTLLEGTDGAKKMSKSYGNFIGLSESPADMFGKVMSIPDALIGKYATLLTDIDFGKDVDPYKAKTELASEIVSVCYDKVAGKAAAGEFKKVFSGKGAPSDTSEIRVVENVSVLDVVISASGISKSEARRLIEQGAVEVDGEKKTDSKEMIVVKKTPLLKVGKAKFYRLVLK